MAPKIFQGCHQTAAISNNEDNEGRFDRTKLFEGFQKMWRYRTVVLLCYPVQILTTTRGGSIAQRYSESNPFKKKLVLSNRCVFRL